MTSRTQPVQAPSGGRYGQRKALEDAQREIPLPNRTSRPVSARTSPQGATVSPPDVFAPTTRPDEPVTAGAAVGAGPAQRGMLPDDPTELLRAIILQGFDRNGSLRRLLERMSRG